MTRLVPLALASIALVASASVADAGWKRSGGGTGPRGGTWSSTGSGSCAYGSCNSQQTFTGPNGGVTTRNGTTTCAGGTCNHSATVTGPRGYSASRHSSWTRN